MKRTGLILNYQDIGGRSSNALSIEQFEEQMKYLSSLNDPCLALNNLVNIDKTVCKSIFITFDGGNRSDIEIVAPILKKYNLRATFFLPADKFEDYDVIWDDYQTLIDDGHEIGSMGFVRSNFSKMNVRQQLYAMKKSKYLLEERLNAEIDYFALPEGKFNHHTIRIASDAEYKMLFTSRFGFISLSSIPFLTKRWKMDNKVSLKMLEKVTQEDWLTLRKIKIRTWANNFALTLFPNSNAKQVSA